MYDLILFARAGMVCGLAMFFLSHEFAAWMMGIIIFALFACLLWICMVEVERRKQQ